jgi:sulfate transport system substrate-binding protein
MSLLRSLVPLVVLVAAVSVSACGGGNEASGAGGDKLALVAYSTPKEAYEEILPAFAKTSAGTGATFTQSYGASGEQARAVQSGLPADVVALSLAPDVSKLVDKGLVAPDWNRGKFGGFVTNSVVVLAVRQGNPKGIRTWEDLLEPGVEVVTPNPFTSGGARWNIMAAYGAHGIDYLKQLFKHVVSQDKSAREALQTFAAGKGDVLLAYENEAITAQQKGQDIDYVIPPKTILIQNPVAVTTKAKNPDGARALVDFLRTPQAQRIFVEKGYRPVLSSVADPKRFPDPPGLFTIDDLGGWSKVSDRFFDPDKGILAEIERDLGVATG